MFLNMQWCFKIEKYFYYGQTALQTVAFNFYLHIDDAVNYDIKPIMN